MMKYRLIEEFDEYGLYQCLSCKYSFLGDFLSQFDYVFCPMCGIKWTERFSKRNKRYRVNDNYHECGKHIIVETGMIQNKALDPIYFGAIVIPPKLIWSLYTHTWINGIVHPLTDYSPVIKVYQSFKRIIKEKRYDYVRLRIEENNISQIIRELKLK